ncbi:hypothetical protein K469DRAFT_689900 [Zopfia rhizophila CBS 207.26]|uniref:Protein BNI4 n=1 Tax=Zopfia rhizophila CBS 207.26 TaxID=1314779 RepID=A0A6A6E1J5_9PEZI|nr:hypothetical protein K469DRAFT_689900 [Zopfia rhizophila CBS 207.26]
MAQVLAPIVQTSSSITMLHSSSDAFQNTPSTQPHHQQSRSSQMPRSQIYNTQNGGAGYRGTSSAPIAPYAFSSTPQLRQENRSSPAPGNPYNQPQIAPPSNSAKLGHPSHPSSSSDSTVSTSGSSSRSMAGPQFASKDDTTLGVEHRKSTVDALPTSAIAPSTSAPDLSLSPFDAPVKPSPDRYRRGTRRVDSNNSVPTSSFTPTPTHSPSLHSSYASVVSGSFKPSSVSSLAVTELEPPKRPGHNRANSADDMQLPRQGSMDQAKRYRRRSLGGFEATNLAPVTSTIAPVPITSAMKRPSQEFRPSSNSSQPGSRAGSSHERQGSAGSVSSGTSARPSSSRQEPNSLCPSPANAANPPSRGSSEPTRRVVTPSPLSKPISPSEPPSPAKPSAQSPAVQQLTALNDKESGKGMKSRLRRAFSFGSAAELRRASAENNLSAERARLRKDRHQNEHDAEQDAIIAKQEAAGIGAGIYSGQGGFSGSTDNLSISSTASSASVMLRKMGSGMRKGTRSIKGLFRPKSVIGVPAADTAVTQPSVGQVSMVTVEAERQKVNVNADPHDQVGGGTGYPRLERNSLDTARTATDGPSNLPTIESWSRKSIVGGDRERAEVLSSMKKGILKRAGTGSDTSSPVAKPTDIPHPTDTPKSSAPSTPNDDHSHPVQIHINGDDYFGGKPRLPNTSTRSLPNTPQGATRNISFSPRIQFHDAWSSTDYDRRGEIATCNRLTPMLAQQIKEELNSFKMEMEVHELSKPHTHFF